jgi:hypothetical protein
MKTNLSLLYFVLGCMFTFFLLDIRNKCFVKNSAKANLDRTIKILVRQAARWSTAAKQDKSDLIAVLHANYGAGYLWALNDIATSEQIKSATGLDINKITLEIINTQDIVTKRIIKKFPSFGPARSYLTEIAGE